MAVGAAAVASVTLLTVLISVLYIYIKRWRTYWKRRNVPELGEGVIFGIYKDTMLARKTISETYRKTYDENRDLKYYGTFFFGRPTLVVQDIEIIKDIMTKEFANFSGHGFLTDEKRDPFSGNLFNLDGAKWKAMRNKLTVTFTSGKLKYMFDTMQECIQRFHGVIDKELEMKGQVNDMKEKLACLGTDIIASVAFGIEVNSLENPKAEFRRHGRLMFTPCLREFMRMMVFMNMHWLAKLFNVKQANPDSYDFLMNMVKRTVDYREKNNVKRNDFLNMMVQLKNEGFIELEGKESAYRKNTDTGYLTRLTIEEVSAQVFIFYAAGFETVSTATTFALYELSINKDVQKKVQEECDRVLESTGGKVTYEAVQSMTYSEKVLYETLRFFPPMGGLLRTTSNDCTLPLTDIKLDKDTSITIPIQGLHMDPRYFPDPERFDPERFSEEEKASRPAYCYMPFGEGPRICIGMRFALVEVKSVLLGLMSRYNFELAKDIAIPIKIDPKALIPVPEKIDFIISKRIKSA